MRLVSTATPLLLVSLVLVTACQDRAPLTSVDRHPSLLASATHVEGDFFATAACLGDIGFDIRFGGPRVMVRHVSGTDTTLSFRTQEFQGWRLPETVFDATSVDYAVLGGAEMFNIKRAPDGSLDVRIHEGTLVFEPLGGGANIVARHVIRVVPGQTTVLNTWFCRRTG